MTKLYLHATTSGTPSGTLPSDEQSSLTPDANDFEGSRTTNRLMNTSIGVSQANLTNSSTADTNPHNYYVSRWVSPVLYQANIQAQTFTLEFGAKESNANANWPVSSTSQPLRINCYIWKPSDGTKVGTILDGNSNSDFEEAGTSQSVISGTFAGAAVTGLTPGDACLVYEMWAVVTQGTGTARTDDVYYDGTTENSTTNEAAFLSSAEELVFASVDGLATQITAGGSWTSTANTTSYLAVAGGVNTSSASTTQTDVAIKFRTTGTLSNLGIRCTNNGITGNNVLTVQKNGSNGNNTVTFGTGVTGYKEDLTHTDTIADGDTVSLKFVPGGATGTVDLVAITMVFAADDGTSCQILSTSESKTFATASVTHYFPIHVSNSTGSTENNAKVKQKVAGTYSKLYVNVISNARTTDTTFKSRKNGANGNLTVTYTSGQTGIKEDTSNSDTIAVDDDYCMSVTTSTGTENIVWQVVKVEFKATSYYGVLLGDNNGGETVNANVTTYMSAGGKINPHTTEANRKRRIRLTSVKVTNLQVWVAANTVTAASTVTLMVNGVASSLSASITASTQNTLFVDNSNSAIIGSGDDITFRVITGATGTSLVIHSVTAYYKIPRLSLSRSYLYHLLGRISLSRIYKYNLIGRISLSRIYKYHVTNYVSLSRIYKYNILGRVSLSRIYKYHLQARVSLSRIYKYHLVGRISQSRIYKYNILARVSLSRIYKYHVTNLVSLARTYKYNIIGRISLSRIYKWHLNARVSLSRTYKYNLIGRISKSSILLYNIVGRISLSRIYKYNVIGRISLVKIYKYHIQGRVSQAQTYKYNIQARVSLARTYLWNVVSGALDRISQSQIYKWNVIGRVTSSGTYKYNIVGRVSLSRSYLYNVLGRVSLSRTYLYNIIGRISLSRIYKYNLIGRVSLSRIYKYNINQRISLSRIYKYNVLGRVSLARVYKYNLLGRVSLARTYLWNVIEPGLTRISKDQIYKWNVQARVSLTQIYKYHVATRVSLSRIYKYNILNRVSLSRIYKYNMNARVSLSRIYKYNLIGRVSKSVILKYHLVTKVSKSQTYLWNITNRVSKAVIFKWNVLARVTLERIYRWDFGRLTTTRDRAITGSTEGKQRFPKQFSQVKSFFYNPPETRARRNSKYRRG